MAAVRTVYVVSDLHLGGEPEEGRRGFRICTHENELATFIRSLGGRQDHPSELVLNGDTFDFLAEKASDEQPFWADFRGTEQAGLNCLNTIAEDRCPGVIQALRADLEQGHRLVILPGNHDIELSLPAVRRRLRCCLINRTSRLPRGWPRRSPTMPRGSRIHAPAARPWTEFTPRCRMADEPPSPVGQALGLRIGVKIRIALLWRFRI
jgi:hypothetical protein